MTCAQLLCGTLLFKAADTFPTMVILDCAAACAIEAPKYACWQTRQHSV